MIIFMESNCYVIGAVLGVGFYVIQPWRSFTEDDILASPMKKKNPEIEVISVTNSLFQ